jgi:hypothetical protein
MKRPVIKVAKKGYDIRTATTKNLTIDSTKNQLKLFKRITVITDIPV